MLEVNGGFDVVGVEVGLGLDAVAWHFQLLREETGGVGEIVAGFGLAGEWRAFGEVSEAEVLEVLGGVVAHC